MVKLESTADGVLLRVLARPSARKNAVTGTMDGMLKVSVTQAPEAGKANGAVVRVLAKALQLKRSQLSLVSGATSPKKKFLVAGESPDGLRARIAHCIELDPLDD